MGCQPSCFDSNDLILSQRLDDRLQLCTIPKPTPSQLRCLLESLLGQRENFETLSAVLSLWIPEVYSVSESKSGGDLETLFSYNLQSSVLIKHTLNGKRDFSLLDSFCTSLRGLANMSQFSLDKLSSETLFLSKLRPLGTTVYLALGDTIDCGIGIEKLIDFTHLQAFLGQFYRKIEEWMGKGPVKPIPTYIEFSSLKKERQIEFHIFGGFKSQNYEKGFELFSMFQLGLPRDLMDLLKESKSEDVKCALFLTDTEVRAVKIDIFSHEKAKKVAIYAKYKLRITIDEYVTALKPTVFSVMHRNDRISLALQSHIIN